MNNKFKFDIRNYPADIGSNVFEASSRFFLMYYDVKDKFDFLVIME